MPEVGDIEARLESIETFQTMESARLTAVRAEVRAVAGRLEVVEAELFIVEDLLSHIVLASGCHESSIEHLHGLEQDACHRVDNEKWLKGREAALAVLEKSKRRNG